MTGGTLVARGMVMVGTMGRHEGGNYVVALDAETGEEAWRFGTIPAPDDRRRAHLERHPPRRAQRGVGLGARQLRPRQQPGPVRHREHLRHGAAAGSGRAAGNEQRRPLSRHDAGPRTRTPGELAWHFQHQANGQWDLDWAFERQIAELPVDGEPTSVVVTIGKQAIFDLVETATGKLHLVASIWGCRPGITATSTPVTGRKTQDPLLIPGDGETKRLCPHVGGGRSWAAYRLRPAARTSRTCRSSRPAWIWSRWAKASAAA